VTGSYFKAVAIAAIWSGVSLIGVALAVLRRPFIGPILALPRVISAPA
jgi:hypothetical protein